MAGPDGNIHRPCGGHKIVCALFCFVLLIVGMAHAQKFDQAIFEGYDAAFIMDNRSSGERINIDPDRSALPLTPCSTFKIYNTLIGLELGLIKDPDAPWYVWDGVQRSIQVWNRDLTLREAFHVSAVPAYQILARQIGSKRMQDFLNRMKYGTQDISAGIDIFWLDRPEVTSIKISADQQLELLNQMLDGTLPFSKDNIVILKDVMRTKITDKGTLYGKTGSSFDDNGVGVLGWFIGFLETEKTVYTFVCCIKGGENSTGANARAKVERIFQDMGLL